MELPDKCCRPFIRRHRDRKLECIKRRAGTGVWLSVLSILLVLAGWQYISQTVGVVDLVEMTSRRKCRLSSLLWLTAIAGVENGFGDMKAFIDGNFLLTKFCYSNRAYCLKRNDLRRHDQRKHDNGFCDCWHKDVR